MFTADLLERAVKTWVQTFLTVFLGALVVPANVFSVGGWKAAGLGALAGAVSAAFSAAMSLLSKPVGNKNTASIVAPAAPAPRVIGKPGVTVVLDGSSTAETAGLVTLADQGIDPTLGHGDGDYPKNVNAAGG